MQYNSRVDKSIKNINVSIISYFFVFLLQLINRQIFVRFLAVEYLGLNGLFSNILSMLSLADLGIANAMAFALYKPISNGEIEIIKGIMELYRKLYTRIGLFVIFVGCLLIPFMKYFIKDIPEFISLSEIQSYYAIYVLCMGGTYFGAYKRTIIICDQKQYIVNFINSLSKVLLIFFQIIVLMIWKNYLIYLLIMLLSTIIENVLLILIANKLYPYLKTKSTEKLNQEIVGDLRKNIFAMIFHRIGDVVINATDNLIITKFSSLTLTGLYSNYFIIINAVKGVLNQVFSAISASVGNLVADGDYKHDEEVFYRILFGAFLIYSFTTTGLFIFLNSFIDIWLGERYLFGFFTVAIICVNYYLTGMMKPVRLFRDAAGVFYYDRYKAIVESIVNIVLSIPLTINFGVAGALLGTIISCITVSFWIEAYFLFKYHFKKSIIKYIFQQLIYTIYMVTNCLLLFVIIRYIKIDNKLVEFVIEVTCFVIFEIIIICVVFWRNDHLIYYKELLVRKLSKLKKFGKR